MNQHESPWGLGSLLMSAGEARRASCPPTASCPVSDATLSDEKLMSALAEGDIDALGELVHRHQGRALHLARRVTGASDLAEDVVQDAFLRVYGSAARYRPSAKFTTWLHRIVVNLCWDLRRRWRTVADLPREEPHPQGGGPQDCLADVEKRATVRRAIAVLPERQRLAVVLHRFEGKTMREVAEVTGWTESAVESCLVRAYRQLRRDLASLAPAGPSDLPQDSHPRIPQESRE